MSDDDTIAFEFESGETVPVNEIDLSISNDCSGEITTIYDDFNTEYEGSFTLELDTQEVVCPHCNGVNHVPEGGSLRLFGDDPFPCVTCGYPLL